MCVPACRNMLAQAVGRRDFLKAAGLLAAGVAATGCAAPAAPAPAPAATGVSFTEAVDLTHLLTPDFPTFFGVPQLEIETITTLAADGFNTNRWLLMEHTGTHLDAPFHFSGGATADALELANLIGPLAVVDIRAKAQENPDAQLTLDDLTKWESEHGPLPNGCIVAMSSGWDAHLKSPKFRGQDESGGLHFPGFHIEAIEFLIAEREVKGIVVDTLSLDHGPSQDFAVHGRWLPSNRWGIEAAANLSRLPASGATLIVGGPKVAGATGGPVRLMALV